LLAVLLIQARKIAFPAREIVPVQKEAESAIGGVVAPP